MSRKKTKYFFFAIVLVISSEILLAQISADAIELTLRAQESIELDSILAKKIDSSLSIARSVSHSLDSIHSRSSCYQYQLIISTSASWNEAWKRLELWTGEKYIDSLGKLFGLIKVDTLYRQFGYILTFDRPLQMSRLSVLYKNYHGVNFAEPNGTIGDGDNIEYFRKNTIDHFVFSLGTGDCPAGCMHRFYWYVSVIGSGMERKALLEESRDRSGARIYRWNIPPRYAMTMFPNLDSVLSAVETSPNWWVRRHAIEGIWRFFVETYPWVGEDINKTWDTLHTQVTLRKNDIVNVLQTAQSDQDPDVKASAEFALNKIKLLNVSLATQQPQDFALFQNYPNPFNPSTQLQFRIAGKSTVSLKVFNMLGQEVALLVHATLQAGIHSVDWNAGQFPSGIYFYTLRAGEFTASKKMLLLK